MSVTRPSISHGARQGWAGENFLANEDLKRACVRSLEIIDEATKQIQADFRETHPELPWRLMTGMRDRLIHDYGGVDYEIVWQTVTEDVPDLLAKVERILDLEE